MPASRNYFQYLLRSKGRHGIHSAFVFDFVDKCLTTKVDKNFISERKKWVKKSLLDNEEFKITDLGVGSKKMTVVRSVAKLVKSSSSLGIYGDLIWKIARYYQPKLILELGTSIGAGSITMKNAAPDSHLITVEGCDETLRRAYKQFDYWNLNKITPIQASFDDFLTQPDTSLYDLVFLDGNHESKATIHYLDLLMNKTTDETIFILDDIRWNDDMWSLWNQLVNDDRFHVSIDLGRMGILCKKTSQAKEHFMLRPKIFKTKLF